MYRFASRTGIQTLGVSLSMMLVFTTHVFAQTNTSSPGWLKYKAYVDSQQDTNIIANLPAVEVLRFEEMVTHEHNANHVLVRFKPGMAVASAFASLGLFHERTLAPVDDLHRMRVPDGANMVETLEQLNASDLVTYAELDLVVHTTEIPNDPLVPSGAWWLTQIRAFEAWDFATDASNIGPVAVFDTGVLTTHADLDGNLWVNTDEIAGNGVDDDGNGYVDDIHGINVLSGNLNHGTAVSGTICGEGDNGTGSVGSAWKCQIMDINSIAGVNNTVAAVVEGFGYALAENSRISNHSWRIFTFSQALADVIDVTEQAGHLVVAAAGNEGNDIDAANRNFPARLPNGNIITVAATNQNDSRKSYSSYGPVSVDLASPTEFISTSSNGGYAGFSGTSQATPVVAGAVALAWSQVPGWDYQQIRAHVFQNVRPSSFWTGVVATGGILDMGAMLRNIPRDPSLSITDITVNESDANATLTVSIAPASSNPASVDVTTSNGTATNGTDFIATPTTLNFAANETEKSFTVQIIDDARTEETEQFTASLSNANGVGISRGEATVSIEDNDQSSNNEILFKDDFESSTGWTVNPNSSDTASTGIWAVGDPVQTSSDGSGQPIQLGNTTSGTKGLITDPSAAGGLGCCDIDNGVTSIRSPTIPLPATGPITLSLNWYFATTLNATADDYFRLTVEGSNGSKIIIDQKGTANVERPGAWLVSSTDISEFAGQTITLFIDAADAGTASLIEAGVDDVLVEGAPISPNLVDISIADASADETNNFAAVNVSLSQASTSPVTVSYATSDGSAIDTNDYTAISGEFTFAPGETAKIINVPLIDDTVEEATESFNVELSNPAGGNIIDGTASVTIIDNDGSGGPLPVLTIADASVAEDNGSFTIEVTLSAAAPGPVTVNMNTIQGTAEGGKDYWGFARTLSFAAGEQTTTTDITILDDTDAETDETLVLRLYDPAGATIGTNRATLTIIDDDSSTGPALSVADVEVNEGDGSAELTISLSAASSSETTVSINTIAGTATPGTDFYGFSRNLTIAAGELTTTTSIDVLDDVETEDEETFQVRLFNASGATITSGRATVTIVDNDSGDAKLLSVADLSINEDSGDALITVTLSSVSTEDVSVGIHSVAGTATGGSDYYGFTQTLTIAAGETSASATVTVLDDSEIEGNETFRVRLFDATGANISTELATVTIVDNDDDGAEGALSIADISANESDGIAIAVVRLSVAGTTDVEFKVHTIAGTAIGGGNDFIGFTKTVTIPAGGTEAQVSVTLTDDGRGEDTETLQLRLYEAVGATIERERATITILDQ